MAELRLQSWSPQRLGMVLSQKIHKNELKVLQLEQQLQLKNPSLILERGCGILFDLEGKSIRSVEDAAPGQKIRVRLSDGTLFCDITEIETL